MSDTFTQLHIQFIFAVKKRQALINDNWREGLHRLITGIVQKKGHKMLQINSVPDHLHFLIGMRPHQSCSDLIKSVKIGSVNWIGDQRVCRIPFQWQEGFGAFSYAPYDVENVVHYIQNQKEHHKKESFIQEYRRFLIEFGIGFDERFIFHEPE